MSSTAHAPAPRNILGILGFCFSFLGLLIQAALSGMYAGEVAAVRQQSAWTLVALGALSPLGLLVSAAGVFRLPKGLATAGVMLGLLGTLFLSGAGVLLLANELELFTPPQELEKRREERTLAAVKKATDIIQSFVMQNGVAPADGDGRQMIRGLSDGWGKPLQYLSRSGKQFLVISAGPDGEYGNADDVTNETIQANEGKQFQEIQGLIERTIQPDTGILQ
jgi:hypothetical protein